MRLYSSFGAMGILVSGLCYAIPATAQVIAVDDFESYTAGDQLHTLAGGSGWTAAWDVPTAARRPETTIVNGGLSYTLGDIDVAGGNLAAQYAGTEAAIQILAGRAFPAQAGAGPLYMSFLYTQSAQSGGDNDHMQIGWDTSVTNPRISAVDRDNGELQLRSTTSTANSVGSGVESTLGQTYFMVLRAEKTGGSGTYNDIRLFVNPVSPTEAFNAFTPSTVNSGLDLSGAAAFTIRKAFQENGDTFVLDNVTIGESFADVAPASTDPNRVTLTTAAGSGADAFVRSGNQANNNFGSEATIHVKPTTSDTGDFNRKGYLRFDLSQSTLTNPLERAELNLTVEGFTPLGSTGANEQWDFSVWGLADGHAGENWGEGGITWNNAPGNDTASAGGVLLADMFNGAPLATFSLDGFGDPGELITLDSDTFPDLLDFLASDTDGATTFIITRDTVEFGGNSVVHEFFAKEGGAGAPFLVLEQVVPEPASIALWTLLGLCGIGYAWRRRQRAAA